MRVKQFRLQGSPMCHRWRTGEDLRREKTSVSQEDYLKAIWEMLEEDQTPISARLAEELNVTPPAVTAAIKRMTRDGLVKLTAPGASISAKREGRLPSASRYGISLQRCCLPT